MRYSLILTLETIGMYDDKTVDDLKEDIEFMLEEYYKSDMIAFDLKTL